MILIHPRNIQTILFRLFPQGSRNGKFQPKPLRVAILEHDRIFLLPPDSAHTWKNTVQW